LTLKGTPIVVDVSEALDDLYRVFARYPRPETFLACGCCFDGVEVEPTGWNGTSRPIVRARSPGGKKPLRELTLNDLEGFIGDVPLTSGDTALLKHYLPRAFELALQDEPLEDPGVVWGTITWSDPPRFAPWTKWPREEQDAIVAFMVAAWTEHSTPRSTHASDVLEGVIYVAQDMQPFLDIWALTDPDALHRQEVFAWSEKPGTQRSEGVARRNWETTRRWLADGQ
jgi:hypothetical protein